MVWDSSHYSFCPVPISQQNSSLKGESSFLVVCGVRANFSGDILDKQYLEWIENHYCTYCSIYHNCKTITKTLVHDPCSSMFITHIAVGQILSSARFGIFHCQIVFLLGGRPELLQFWCCMFTGECMLNSEWKKKKRIRKKHRYFNGYTTLSNSKRYHKTTAYQEGHSYQKQNWPIKPPRTFFWKCSDQASAAHLSSLFVTALLWHLGVALAITSRKK